jgi:hypothetical protein
MAVKCAAVLTRSTSNAVFRLFMLKQHKYNYAAMPGEKQELMGEYYSRWPSTLHFKICLPVL